MPRAPRTLPTLELTPTSVKPPKPPVVPATALAAVGAERAIFRASTENGDTVVWAERARTAPSNRRRVLFVVSGRTVRASFDMPRPTGDASFREVLHGDGRTFLYADDGRVWALSVGDEISWRQVFREKPRERGPSEAVPLHGCNACMMHSRAITVTSARWRKTSAVGLDALGHVHLARSEDGKRLLVSSYDAGSTTGGPVLTPRIVLYDVVKGGLVERARGDGPGRDPFFRAGRPYVTRGRKVHEVREVARPVPAPSGKRYADKELEFDRARGTVRVCGRSVSLSADELALLWLFVENVGAPVTYDAYFGEHLGVARARNDARLLDGRVSRMRRKLEDQGFSDRLVELEDRSGYTLLR